MTPADLALVAMLYALGFGFFGLKAGLSERNTKGWKPLLRGLVAGVCLAVATASPVAFVAATAEALFIAGSAAASFSMLYVRSAYAE
jgi:hypothetical protein